MLIVQTDVHVGAYAGKGDNSVKNRGRVYYPKCVICSIFNYYCLSVCNNNTIPRKINFRCHSNRIFGPRDIAGFRFKERNSERTDGRTDERTNGQSDGLADGQTDGLKLKFLNVNGKQINDIIIMHVH